MGETSESLRLRIGLSGMEAVQAQLDGLGKSVEKMGERVKQVGEAFLVLAGLESIREAAMQVLELGSSLNVLKARVGATIPELLAMQKILRENGGSADEAAGLFQHLQRSIVEAAESGGALESAFETLGLDSAKLSAMAPGKQFLAVAEALTHVENQARKTQLAMAIFGREGAIVNQAFGNMAKVQEEFAGKGAFAQVMARDAEMFHQVEVSIHNFAMNGLKLVAGVMDQIVPSFKEWFDALGKIDFTEVGQKIGAFGAVIIKSWKEGNFVEMLSLLIEAGFELGGKAARKAMQGVGDFIQSDIPQAIINGLIIATEVFANGMVKLTLNVIAPVSTLIAAVTDVAMDYCRAGVEHLGEFMKQVFFGVVDDFKQKFIFAINLAILGFNEVSKLFGGKGDGKLVVPTSSTYTPKDVDPATANLADKFKEYAKTTHGIVDDVNQQLAANLAASEKALALTRGKLGTDGSRSALEQLQSLITKQRELIEAKSDEEEQATETSGAEIRAFQIAEGAAKAVLALEADIAAVKQRAALAETSLSATDVDKWDIRKKALEDEAYLNAQLIKALETRVAAFTELHDVEKANAAQKELDAARNKADAINTERGKLGADPHSLGEQMQATLTKLRTEWGTWAQQAASSFASVFHTAISSISNGITGLIMGTKTWGMALREIGVSVMTSIIQSIVEMGVKFVMTQLMMAVFGKALMAAQLAAIGPMAVAASALWAAPATLAAIATAGGAAAAAPGEILAAQGIVAAGSMASFAEGGYTGAGGKYDYAGVVHRGEFVMPASAVSRIGLPTLNTMKAGGGGEGSGAGGGGGVGNVMVHVWGDDRKRMIETARNSPEFQHIIINHVTQQAHRIPFRK